MKTVRRPPYPKWNPGYFPCSSLTPLPLSSRRPSVSFGGFGLREMLIYSSALTLLVGAWLALIVFFPRKWAALVDKEYNFWMRRGIMEESSGDRLRNFDKSRSLVVIVAALFVFFVFLTVFLFTSGL